MTKQLKSTFIMLTAAIIWGFAFVAQVTVDNNVIGNFTFNGIRFLIGSLSLIPVILIFEREKADREKWKNTIISAAMAGTALFIASATQQQGISMNHNAGKSGFITSLYTILVPIFGWIIWRNKAGLKTWLAALLAVTGLFLLSAGEGFDSIEAGDIVVLISSLFWAIHILVLDKKVPGLNPITFSSIQFAFCGLWNILFALMCDTITWNGIVLTAFPILFTGIMSTGIAYTCQVVGQRDADPNYAAIILSTECIFSAVGGAIFLNESFTLRGYIGCILIFAGIVISQLKKKGE